MTHPLPRIRARIPARRPARIAARRPTRAMAAALAATALAVGCAAGDGPAGGAARVAPPPAGAGFDYQIGGAYRPPAGVRVVSRDRGDAPAPGLYSVCYVNAFQAQPDRLGWWKREHPRLLLREDGPDSAVVMDKDWGEALLDVSTAGRRAELARIVGGWIDGCAARGYRAVEPDNLDSYERSGGRLTPAHNAAFARLLVGRAHAAGLAVAQKNTTGLLGRAKDIGFDFAVAEECGEYDECGRYATTYANRVLVVAYRRDDFDRTCRRWGGRLSVVLRDHDVTPAGDPHHVFSSC